MIALFVFFLSGCGPQPSMSINIDSSREGVTEITASELEALKTSGVDFILYISSVTCSSCAEFRPILDQFIRDSGFQVYKIESDDDAFPRTNSIIAYELTPSLVLVSNGEIRDLIQSFDDPKPFSSVAELEKYLLNHVVVPSKDNVYVK
jgi:thioredoxin-like negative regulator of GroEL